MNTAMPPEHLQEVFDQIVQEVTEQVAGIRLVQGESAPSGEVCTVHADFSRGFHSGVSLCADTALFVRLTQQMMRQEDITPENVEDFTKEYFNVLCGQIAVKMFQATRVASRFCIPHFHSGRYEPEGSREHFVLSYTSDRNEDAQLIHHTPVPAGGEAPIPADPL